MIQDILGKFFYFKISTNRVVRFRIRVMIVTNMKMVSDGRMMMKTVCLMRTMNIMGLMVRETTSIAKWGYEDGIESILGWGVVPKMAPPPSQGGSTLQ